MLFLALQKRPNHPAPELCTWGWIGMWGHTWKTPATAWDWWEKACAHGDIDEGYQQLLEDISPTEKTFDMTWRVGQSENTLALDGQAGCARADRPRSSSEKQMHRRKKCPDGSATRCQRNPQSIGNSQTKRHRLLGCLFALCCVPWLMFIGLYGANDSQIFCPHL